MNEGKGLSLQDFLHMAREVDDHETSIDDHETGNDIDLSIKLGWFCRYLLEKITWVICPICEKHQDIKYNTILDGGYHKLRCTNCRQELGYISGIVEAKKIGSYIRLRNEKNDIKRSVNIYLFKNAFDVRNKDEVSIIYHLKTSDKTPVLIINNTTKEYFGVKYYYYDRGEFVKWDFTQRENLEKLEEWVSEKNDTFMVWDESLDEALKDEPSLKFE